MTKSRKYLLRLLLDTYPHGIDPSEMTAEGKRVAARAHNAGLCDIDRTSGRLILTESGLKAAGMQR